MTTQEQSLIRPPHPRPPSFRRRLRSWGFSRALPLFACSLALGMLAVVACLVTPFVAFGACTAKGSFEARACIMLPLAAIVLLMPLFVLLPRWTRDSAYDLVMYFSYETVNTPAEMADFQAAVRHLDPVKRVHCSSVIRDIRRNWDARRWARNISIRSRPPPRFTRMDSARLAHLFMVLATAFVPAATICVDVLYAALHTGCVLHEVVVKDACALAFCFVLVIMFTIDSVRNQRDAQ